MLAYLKGVYDMNHLALGNLLRRQVVIPFTILLIVISILPIAALNSRAASNNVRTSVKPVSIVFKGRSYTMVASGVTPPTDGECLSKAGHPCYSPYLIRKAYGVTPLLDAGFTGAGQTIVIIDSFGSPTILSDLQTFDAAYGLPDPPSFTELHPLGTIKFNPTNSDMISWAAETTLDVEWAHAIAPGANIILMTSPVDETQGVQGMPEFLYLEQYALHRHLGNIISQSWGTTENTLFTSGGKKVLKEFNAFYAEAAAQHVTVFASTGDAGVANPNVNGHIFPFPTVNFPASSPFVTAVGGTSLLASTTGNYQSETVWNGGQPNGGATGGGVSQFFSEPAYQAHLPKSDQKILNGFRGLPDISWNADPATSILIYLSFLGPKAAGFYFIGGTSEGSPQWAGVIADANQKAGRPLGFLNTALYAIGASEASESYHDITVGNNGQGGLPGYNATPGWDLTTGWGSPKTASLVSELIEQITGK
jgi:subtilase family serine protease